MTTEIEFHVETRDERIDKVLAGHLPDLSRSSVQKMIREGLVLVNDEQVRPSYRTREGDWVVARVPEEESLDLRAEAIPLDVVYEDDCLLVINKPAGMVVHPAFGHDSGTLVNAVLAHVPDIEDEDQAERPGIVHRLDKETSGLIVVAKTGEIRRVLQDAFRAREVKKIYLALAEGQITAGHGIINAAMGRDPRRRKRMAVVAAGRPASTEYRVQERFERYSYLEVQPYTGRTHQIRVHLGYIGHPVVGDTVYGYRKKRLPLDRHFLHANRLVLTHPRTGRTLDLSAPLPEDLQSVLDTLREPSP
jgi:23S rRNA pseudouridine1911/1915/1917 synthase